MERPDDYRDGVLAAVASLQTETSAAKSLGVFRDAARFYGRPIQFAPTMERVEC